MRHNLVCVLVVVAGVALCNDALAHCDSLDGPVVRDAQVALATGDTTIIRRWVAADQEKELLEVFERARGVRTLGAEAREVADRLFFETLVRLHRASEGEAFTGLKPAGSTEPGLLLADAALKSGSVRELVEELGVGVENGIETRFAAVRAAESHAAESVAAGRSWVSAYVDYAHFVEAAHALVTQGAPLTHHEPAASRHE
jgi:Family of unknown function (DUF6448)